MALRPRPSQARHGGPVSLESILRRRLDILPHPAGRDPANSSHMVSPFGTGAEGVTTTTAGQRWGVSVLPIRTSSHSAAPVCTARPRPCRAAASGVNDNSQADRGGSGRRHVGGRYGPSPDERGNQPARVTRNYGAFLSLSSCAPRLCTHAPIFTHSTKWSIQFCRWGLLGSPISPASSNRPSRTWIYASG